MATPLDPELLQQLHAADPYLHRGPITKEVAAQVIHGESVMGRFNNRLALLITTGVGTMWCAYVFALLALISLPSVIAQVPASGPQPLISWIAQTFLQLVLLSVIMVGQRVQQESTDQRATADHQILIALHAVNKTQLEILLRLDRRENGAAGGTQPATSPRT